MLANGFSLPGKACGYSFDHVPTGTQCRIVTEPSREDCPSGAGKGLQMIYEKTRYRWISETAEKARTTYKTSDWNTGMWCDQSKGNQTNRHVPEYPVPSLTDHVILFLVPKTEEYSDRCKRTCAASSWVFLRVSPESGVRVWSHHMNWRTKSEGIDGDTCGRGSNKKERPQPTPKFYWRVIYKLPKRWNKCDGVHFHFSKFNVFS